MRPAPARTIPLLLLVTALFTFLLQSGDLGTSDTGHRLQVTHSLWTGEPQVLPSDYPEFGIHGRGGRLYAWYGIGQSLLMLPADLAGTALTKLPQWRNYVANETDPTIRDLVVSVTTNILLSVLTALVAFRLLGLFGFSTVESTAGTLALLCATTHLHYSQNLTENNYILLLTLSGFALQYRWFLTGNRRALILGSAALGLNLLTRITTALDLLAVVTFLLLAHFFSQQQPPLAPRVKTYLRLALPIYSGFFLIDRIYQFMRFGSWTNTYLSFYAREQRQLHPSLPIDFPFDGHWFRGGLDSGVLGPLFSPAKSIFLFDPLFALTLILAILLWRRLAPAHRAFVVSTLLLLAAYIALYAGYRWWAGDDAWGDRYISSAVQLATLLAVPLLLRYRRQLRALWPIGIAITAVSLTIQCASLAFWLPLEIYQMDTFGPHACVILLRFRNIAALALGKQAAWGLLTATVRKDPWDYARLTTWNVLPAQLRHIGEAPLSTVYILDAVWAIATIALVVAALKLLRSLRDPVPHA